MTEIHETAVVHPTAIIGDNVVIEAYVKIGPYCLIGRLAEDKKFLQSKQPSAGVFIKKGANLTGHVTVDGGTERPTIVGEDCFLMKHSHVGHDVIMQPNVTLSCGAKVGGHSYIMKKANIGLNAVIHQRHVIGEGAMIGMGSVVPLSKNVLPYNKYAGNPIKNLGINTYTLGDITPTDMEIVNMKYQNLRK